MPDPHGGFAELQAWRDDSRFGPDFVAGSLDMEIACPRCEQHGMYAL
jgi:hypothetical protein